MTARFIKSRTVAYNTAKKMRAKGVKAQVKSAKVKGKIVGYVVFF